MELKQFFATLLKWGWLILLAAGVAGVTSYWATAQVPRVYATSTTLMVGRFVESPDPKSQELTISQQLAQTYIQLARRQPVLEATIQALGLDMGWTSLRGNVNASVIAGTQLIQLTVADTNPERAQVLANEVARQLILQSPTTPEQEQEQYRQFVSQQLTDLQSKIEGAEQRVVELESQLATESSAQAIRNLQGQIDAQQQKILTWQSNYANLLDFYDGSRTNSLTVVEAAGLPGSPISPNPQRNVMLAALVGALLAIGGAFFLEYLDDTINGQEEVARVIQRPVLGAITHIPNVQQPSDALVTVRAPRGRFAEEYRLLRTNVQFVCLSNDPATLLISSAGPQEGKSVVASNLAAIMAMAGLRVILVDADLHRPVQHRVFGALNEQGLTSLLMDRTLPLEAALLETTEPNLLILPSGPLPPNPAELLGLDVMAWRLDQMRQVADVVILDGPPVLSVSDASILGSYCDGVILVVRAGKTRTGLARQSREVLEQVGLKLLGVVLNNLSGRRVAGDRYHRHYYVQSDKQPRRQGASAVNRPIQWRGHPLRHAQERVKLAGGRNGRGEVASSRE